MQAAAMWLCKHPSFELFVVLLIIGSSVCLALDVPRLDEGSPVKGVLHALNYVFTAAFTFEAGLKMLGLGLRQYFSEAWNLLDFALVNVSIVRAGRTAHGPQTTAPRTARSPPHAPGRASRLAVAARRPRLLGCMDAFAHALATRRAAVLPRRWGCWRSSSPSSNSSRRSASCACCALYAC